MPGETPAPDEVFAAQLADYHAALLMETVERNERGSFSVPPASENRLDRAQSCLHKLEQLRLACGQPLVGRHTCDAEPRDWREPPPVGDVDPEFRPARFGRFLILEDLGQGAHGMVYRARDPVLEREVALKIPRFETIASPELRARFLRESKAVAALHHPNLLPVFEVGEVGPACFMALQLCRGPSLASWLKQRQQCAMPVSPLLAARIVCTLAETVQYVHSFHVLHRDIKPANILLDPAPREKVSDRISRSDPFEFVPKLTDFGIARIEGGTDAATREGTILGTPAYMAPEQAAGRSSEIGPHTDIYGLGAVLYELLTGRPPFPESNDFLTLRNVMEGTLAPPRRWRADIPRDLESVCLKCLEHQPTRRYASAGDLAADLHRFACGEPVQARPVGRVACLIRWSRRNPVVAGLALSLTTLAVVSLAAMTWLWRQSESNYQLARQNFDQAHQAIHDSLAVVHDGSRYDDPQFNVLRNDLLRTGLKYYRTLLTQSSDDLSLQADTAEALYQIGFIAATTGSKTEALDILEQSLPIWEQLAEQDPLSPDHRFHWGKTLTHIGRVQWELGRLEAAQESYQRASVVLGDLVQRHPQEASYRNALGSLCVDLADVSGITGDWEQAHQHAERGRLLYEVLAEQDAGNGEFSRMLAKCHMEIADAQLGLGETAAALQEYRLACAVCEDLVARSCDMPAAAKTLTHTLLAIGNLDALQGDLDSAQAAYDRSRIILEQLVRDGPEVTAWRRDLGTTLYLTGMLLVRRHEPMAAREHFESALEIREALVADNPEVVVFRRDAGQTRLELGKLQLAAGELDRALLNLEEACEMMGEWVRVYPDDINNRLQLGIAQSSIGETLRRRGNPIAAETR